MDDPVLPFILVAFPIAFTAIWSLVLFICSVVGGWHRLASTYSTDREPASSEWASWQRGRIGLVEMKSTLWIATAEEGLYLKTGPAFVFRFMHPPLLIPWNKVTDIKDVNQLFFSGTALVVDGVTIVLPRDLIEEAKSRIER
ncbi:hypothetical protein GC174_15365 [bacterium]|nr:hypothetical protein [bacterium]